MLPERNVREREEKQGFRESMGNPVQNGPTAVDRYLS
jgi:hypothetical protein